MNGPLLRYAEASGFHLILLPAELKLAWQGGWEIVGRVVT